MSRHAAENHVYGYTSYNRHKTKQYHTEPNETDVAIKKISSANIWQAIMFPLN